MAAVLVAHGVRGSDVDDLLQDVALSLVRRVGELRDGRSLRPWLRTVAVNAARDLLRKHKVRDKVHAPMPVGDEVPVTAEDLGLRDRLADVITLVADLPEDLAEVLIMRSVAGMSQRAAAEALGVPVTTVETRLARARRTLRLRFEQTVESRI